jgi:hypothetical protein
LILMAASIFSLSFSMVSKFILPIIPPDFS